MTELRTDVCFCGVGIVEIPLPEQLHGLVDQDTVWIHLDTRDNRCYPEETAHPESRKLVATPENDVRLGEV